MIAIEIREPGGPEVLVPVERPRPVPGPGEVLIRVAAAGVNRPDVMQRRGQYAPPPGASDIPGLEVAGTIDTVGADVSDWHVGDNVCALVAGGGYAELCVAPAPQCLPVPTGMTSVGGAALPETFFTVWSNVFDRGRLRSGERRSSMAVRADWDDGDSAGARVWGARVRHGGVGGEVRGVRATRRRARHQLSRG